MIQWGTFEIRLGHEDDDNPGRFVVDRVDVRVGVVGRHWAIEFPRQTLAHYPCRTRLTALGGPGVSGMRVPSRHDFDISPVDAVTLVAACDAWGSPADLIRAAAAGKGGDHGKATP